MCNSFAHASRSLRTGVHGAFIVPQTSVNLKQRPGVLMNWLTRRLNILVVLVFIMTLRHAKAVEVRTVALTGQSAAGTASGVIYVGFPSPVLNDSGKTAFLASIGGQWSGNAPISKASGPKVQETSRPSHAGVTKRQARPVGVRSWQFRVSSAERSRRSCFYCRGQSHQEFGLEAKPICRMVAYRGNPAPGLTGGRSFRTSTLGNGRTFTSRPAFNNVGQTAFTAAAQFRDPVLNAVTSYRTGVWSEGSGSLVPVAFEQTHAPGTPADSNFNSFDSNNAPVINDAGHIAFQARATGSSDGFWGVWSDRFGSLALVARTGDQTPGTPDVATFANFFGRPVLNNAGQVAFRDGCTNFGEGIWSERSGSLAPVRTHRAPRPIHPSA